MRDWRTYNYTDSHIGTAANAAHYPKERSKLLGLHLTADLYDCRCPAALLTDAAMLRQTCAAAVQSAGLTGVARRSDDFSAQGGPGSRNSGIVLLSASRGAARAGPQREGVTLDIDIRNFSAAKEYPLFTRPADVFAPRRRSTQALERGAT